MTYLLDTSVCIAYLRRQGGPAFQRRVEESPRGEAVLCSIVKAALWLEVLKAEQGRHRRSLLDAWLAEFESLPFDDDCAAAYAELRAALEAAGTPIGGNDMLIAATALAHNLVLVTGNAGDFGRVPGLRVENWLATD